MKAMKSEKSMATEARPEWGACTDPSGRRRKPWEGWRYDAPGSQNGGIADLCDRLDRHPDEGPPMILGQMEVARDVLHDHDGVINQDADGEDQGEEGDAVQCVAITDNRAAA